MSESTSSTERPQSLILEAGEKYEGIFKALSRGHTREGDPVAIAQVEIDGVPRSIWLLQAALISQFKKCAPKVGERIVVSKAAEKRKSEASGRWYWPFEVTAPDRPEETLTWDDPLLDGDAEPNPVAKQSTGSSDLDDIPFR